MHRNAGKKRGQHSRECIRDNDSHDDEYRYAHPAHCKYTQILQEYGDFRGSEADVVEEDTEKQPLFTVRD
jgi:hypothetical protein